MKSNKWFRADSRLMRSSLSRLEQADDSNVIKRREPYYRVSRSRWFAWIVFLASFAVVVECGIIAAFDVDYQENVADEVIDSVLAVVFCAELFCRFIAYQRSIQFFTARSEWSWNLLDLFLLVIRILRAWVMPFVFEPTEFGAWRIIRLLEMLRVLHVLYFVPQVRLTLEALRAAVGSILPILALFLLTLYAEGTVCTLMFKKQETFAQVGGEDFESRFGTVAWSMLTSLQLAVFDDAGSVIRAAGTISIPLALFLFTCIAVNAFIVLNVLVGFIYDLVEETSAKAAADVSRARIESTFAAIDKDLSGEITEAEYEAQAKPLLRAQGISEEVGRNAFAIIDADGSGRLNKDEFTAYLVKMIRPPSSEEVIRIMEELDFAQHELEQLIAMRDTGTVPDSVMDAISSTSSPSHRRRTLFSSLQAPPMSPINR